MITASFPSSEPVLVAERDRKLTLVSAPAGWGKSTLLREWGASPDETRPFAWLSLDPADSDPVRFWSYAIGALRSVRPDVRVIVADAYTYGAWRDPERALAEATRGGRDHLDRDEQPRILGLDRGPAGSRRNARGRSDDARKYFAVFDWVAEETGTYTPQVTSFESVSTGELVVTRG